MQTVERDPSKSWIEDTAYFKAQCERGKLYERKVAQILTKYGLVIEVHDDGFRKSVDEIAAYTAKSTDLSINGYTLEVKSRSARYAFTKPDDWRFWPMFVDTVSSIDKKSVQPVAYIFISQATDALMGARSAFKEKWTIQERFDNERKIRDNFYCVERKYVMDESELVAFLRGLP